MRMNPNEFGRRLGIGVRIAGRIAQQRAQSQPRDVASASAPRGPANLPPVAAAEAPRRTPALKAAELGKRTRNVSRAAGRGVGGFLRPFGRVGGILWLEVTGFFFGLFAVYFAQDMWRTHTSYMVGPQHQRFLVAAGLTLVFGYLCASAFWRARRR